MDTVTIKKRLEFHTQRLDNLYVAYNKLLSGGVKSYRLDDRELTRLDLGKLSDEKDFKRMPFSFPSVDEQRKITAICSAIDSKIQVNNAINKNLAA